MKLVVGLGNPGRGYADNRHNVGFMCVNHFARTHGIRLDRKVGVARVGTGWVDSVEVALARPQTYMNESGLAVRRLVDRFRVGPGDLIVVHDDLDLPLGKIRIRQGGSSAGHKGIESIIAELGTGDFIRVRVGIGRPVECTEPDIIGYVLGGFGPEEKPVTAELIPRVSEALLCLLTEGVATAANRFN